MKYLQRSACALILFALVTGLIPLAAQDGGAIKGAGSGVVLPLLQRLAEASGAGISLELTTTGTASGFRAFCAGEVGLTGATRTIAIAEENACKGSGITFMELRIAHQILTFIANPADSFLTCLNTTDLDTLFTPAAAGKVTNWNQVKSSYPDLALKLMLPSAGTLTYEQLDGLVKGDGIRSDGTLGNVTTIVQTVTSTPGTLGVVDYQTAQAAGASVKIVNLNITSGGSCTSPDALSVESGGYTASDTLYLYVNAAQAAGLTRLLEFLVSEAASPVIISAGFTPASANSVEANRRIISGEVSGRVFSRSEVEFQIPPNLTGQVNVAGSGDLFDYLKGVSDSLIQTQTGLTVNYTMEGETAGFRRLCNGEADVVVTSSPMTDEQKAACQANNIVPITVSMGTQAVVLVGHEGNAFTQCLTREQIVKIWGAPSTGVKNWKDVAEGLPDLAMTLFGIDAGNSLSDMLLTTPGSPVLPVRVDTELNSDVLYRAAATANVDGALTYMSWADYQRVITAGQARIHLVKVDGGSGCIEPSVETITNGTYPLTQTIQLVISQKSLASLNVQSYVWSLFTDENFNGLASRGLVGIDLNRLSDVRLMLQTEFTNAVTAAAAAESTAVPESTAEATPAPEATGEVTAGPESTVETPAEATATPAAPYETAEPVPTVEETAEATESSS